MHRVKDVISCDGIPPWDTNGWIGSLEENGFSFLPIDLEDAAGVKDLPNQHGDPFDRIQVVQARRRGLNILSHDSLLDRYDIERIG